MRIEVVLAWPERFERAEVELPEGATVEQAVAAAGLPDTHEVVGHAIHGVNAGAGQRLHDGDRVELLRPLLVDPKQARRRRAQSGPG